MAIYVGYIGLVLEATVTDKDTKLPVDISAAVGVGAKTITIESPSGTKTVKEAVFSTNGVDGKMKYTTIAGDITNDPGEWQAQSRAITPTRDFYQQIHSFDVLPTL